MKRIGSRIAVSTSAGLLLAAFAVTFAAAQDARPSSIFGEVIDVRVVNLEVVVTENGERVTGLKPEDFLLTVDGQQVVIEYFTEVHGGTAVVRGDEADVGTLPALAPGVPVSTSYLVFLDEYFMIKPRRNRVIDGLIEQLPLLSPEDRMAIVAFDGRKLEMLSSWSQSVSELTRVLEDARERPTDGLKRIAEQRSYLSTRRLDLETAELTGIQQTGVGGPYSELNRLDPEEEHEAQRLAGQVERVVLAANSALRSFANPPGRKVMLLMSGGWPYNPAQWVVGDLYRATAQDDVKQGDELYGPLVETANRLSYTLYPIDVPHRQVTSGDAEIGLAETAAAVYSLEVDRDQEQRAALHILADDTGGRAILGAARTSAFERVVSDTRTYYWLGFTPQWQGDDSEHDVKLVARRKGLKVRSRESYSDLSRKTEVTMMVESALILGDAPSAAPLYAEIGPGKRSGMGKVMVPLRVLIPISELTFLPYEEKFVAETELRIAVQDEQGNLSEIPVIPLSMALDTMPSEGELRRYETQLKIRKRPHDMIVSIYDNASGKILTTKLEVDPTKATAKAN